MKKRIAMAMSIALMIGSLAGCGGNGGENDETNGSQNGDKVIVIKVADWFAEDHPQNESLAYFEKLLEEATDGRIDVQIYPNNQLGSEEVFIDSVIQGTVEMGVPGTMVSKYAPGVSVCEYPFLFESWDDVQTIYRGEVGKEITASLPENIGIRNLGWTVNGFSEFTCTTPLRSMEDFKGLKYRAANLDYHISMMKGLGTNPVPMAFSEVFTSLESKVIVGQYNPYPTIYNSGFYEVQKYALESHHMFHPNMWIINEKFYQSLPDDLRQALDECVEKAVDYNWEISIQADEDAKQKCIDEGMEVIIPSEEFRQDMIDAMADTYQLFEDNYPGTSQWVEKIKAAL